VSVSTEASHYCALTRGGVVECWGDDRYGQAAAETRAPDGLAFVDLAAGAYYTCALASDGTVRCWGGDVYGAAPAIIRSEFGDAFGG
jgi:alpha-tubulin suppressor-like RCC1 family protein